MHITPLHILETITQTLKPYNAKTKYPSQTNARHTLIKHKNTTIKITINNDLQTRIIILSPRYIAYNGPTIEDPKYLQKIHTKVSSLISVAL